MNSNGKSRLFKVADNSRSLSGLFHLRARTTSSSLRDPINEALMDHTTLLSITATETSLQSHHASATLLRGRWRTLVTTPPRPHVHQLYTGVGERITSRHEALQYSPSTSRRPNVNDMQQQKMRKMEAINAFKNISSTHFTNFKVTNTLRCRSQVDC